MVISEKPTYGPWRVPHPGEDVSLKRITSV